MPVKTPPKKPARPAPVKARSGGLTLTARATVAAADPAAPTKARTFRLVANTGEPMDLWPWDDSVVVDLDTVDASGLPVPALYDHRDSLDTAVGQVTAVRTEGGQLVADGTFTLTDPNSPAYDGRMDYARQVLAKADAGYQWQASIGGRPKVVEKIQAGQTGQANGRTYAGPVNIARGVVLREISFVVLGADRRTSAVVARHRRIKGSASMDFATWLASMGWPDESQLDPVQRANMEVLYQQAVAETGTDTAADAETAAADETPEEEKVAAEDAATDEEKVAATEDEEEVAPTNAKSKGVKLKAKAAGATAERARVTAIMTICASVKDPKIKVNGVKRRLSDVAIKAGWTVDRVKTEALKAKRQDRPKGPAVISRDHNRDCSMQALQGAMLLRCGGRLDAKAYQTAGAVALGLPAWLRAGINDANRNRVMEAAHRYAKYSAVDICREAIRASGQNVPHDRDDMIRAAFSGGSLANVITTNVNAILLSTYLEHPDTTMGWVKEADVSNYLLQERPRLLKGGSLSKLPAGGTADHMSRTDAAETYKIARYAGQMSFDEIDVVNDLLNALADMPVEMGNAAARLRPDLVYAEIMSNPTLTTTARAPFNSTDGNLKTTAALTTAGKLEAACSAMRLFRENGVNLNLMPTHLIVPTALEGEAYRLLNSQQLFIATGSDTTLERGDVNPVRRFGLTPVADSRLDNGVTHPDTGTAYAGSATTWYLGSTYAHGIEVGYLSGSGRAPRTRSWQYDREGKFGLGWDVSMSIGVCALDWKGLLKNTA